MSFKGVLFDFSGTLFRIESVRSWLRAALDARGVAVGQADFDRYARQLAAAAALPGGPPPVQVPPRLAATWAEPDARLFRTACALLDLNPADVVMVGDDRHADGGAAALGCDVRFVDPLPGPGAARRTAGSRAGSVHTRAPGATTEVTDG